MMLGVAVRQNPKAVPVGTGVIWQLRPSEENARRNQHAEEGTHGRGDHFRTGDITYIATEEGWLFLAVGIDPFSRKVVGWSIRPDMHRNQVIDALEMAVFQRRPQQGGLIFHSDRGSQYASEDFRGVIEKHGIRPSMSRKGNCWDNAVTETLFGSLKVERLHGGRFESIRQAKDAVLRWLFWYNRQRMHSTLNYLSPVEFESRWENQGSLAAA